MPEAEFRRPHHRVIAGILRTLDGKFLAASRCYFGGGTSLALLYGEYRESRDIDFLCSDRDGFRAIREAVRTDSLGRVARKKLSLAREVRADRDGIRTFIEQGDVRIKFEIILEARIDLTGSMSERLGVPILEVDCLVAEKMLANADRGNDDSTWSRDLIDLAFLAARGNAKRLEPGLALAKSAYGESVVEGLQRSLERLRARRGRLAACALALGVEDKRTLKIGLSVLRRLASR